MKGHVEKYGTKRDYWRVVVERGRDASGKRLRDYYYFRGTKGDAERVLVEKLHSAANGGYVEPSRRQVDEYLLEWLDTSARPRVSAKTLERYTEIVRLHLVPGLGSIKLQELDPRHIQAYYAEALGEGKPGAQGLASQTVLHHHRVLSRALKQAVKTRLIGWNPCEGVEPPRVQSREMEALDEEGTARLLEAARGGRFFVPCLIAVTTGLRRGELLALRWRDVDLENGCLAVTRAVEQTKGGLSFKSPKTSRSRRRVALPPLAVDALRRHRKEQAEVRLALGSAYHDGDLVVCMSDGQPWRPKSFSSAYLDFRKKHGITARFHDLRHSHASQLLKNGVPVKVVTERLGHSTSAFTLDVYSHVLPGMQEDAAQRLDDSLRAALEDVASA